MRFYSHNDPSLAMSTLAIWCRFVRSRNVSLHNFDGLAISGLAFSVAPSRKLPMPLSCCLVVHKVVKGMDNKLVGSIIIIFIFT